MKLILITSFLFIYYSIFYFTFIRQENNYSSPVLKKRFGDILWDANTNSNEGEFHTYCYYPGRKVNFAGKGNEYIIKRVESLNDCQNWHGIFETQEAFGISEKEKIALQTP